MHNAAQPPKHRFNIRSCARAIAPPTMQSTHSQLTALPRITLYYNSSLFYVAFFCSFYFFSADLAADRTHRPAQYTATPLLCPHAPTNPFACRPHTLLRSAMRRHSASARFSRPFRAPSAKSAAAFAAELPLDDPPRLFQPPLFPQAVQGSAFLCVLVSCGTYVLSFTKTSTFIEVFARLCIFIHCVIACFFAYPFAFSVPAILSPLSLRG